MFPKPPPINPYIEGQLPPAIIFFCPPPITPLKELEFIELPAGDPEKRPPPPPITEYAPEIVLYAPPPVNE